MVGVTVNDQMHRGMAEATRLTRQGHLEEATAAIQRILGGEFFPASSPGGAGDTDVPMDVTSRLVKETPQGSAVGRRKAVRGTDSAARTTPRPTLRTPGKAAGRNKSVGVPEGGRFVERSYTNGAGTCSYKLYIPSGYAGGGFH
jgi:hypothetical protein